MGDKATIFCYRKDTETKQDAVNGKCDLATSHTDIVPGDAAGESFAPFTEI
jgi:hypothetical protein